MNRSVLVRKLSVVSHSNIPILAYVLDVLAMLMQFTATWYPDQCIQLISEAWSAFRITPGPGPQSAPSCQVLFKPLHSHCWFTTSQGSPLHHLQLWSVGSENKNSYSLCRTVIAFFPRHVVSVLSACLGLSVREFRFTWHMVEFSEVRSVTSSDYQLSLPQFCVAVNVMFSVHQHNAFCLCTIWSLLVARIPQIWITFFAITQYWKIHNFAVQQIRQRLQRKLLWGLASILHYLTILDSRAIASKFWVSDCWLCRSCASGQFYSMIYISGHALYQMSWKFKSLMNLRQHSQLPNPTHHPPCHE